MLQPFITPTVARYNFNTSSCNYDCSSEILKCNFAAHYTRVLYWIAMQVNIREVHITVVPIKFRQRPIGLIKLYTASNNKFSEDVSSLYIQESLHLGKINRAIRYTVCNVL